jgi:putative GTP pyrophosphokinase
MRWASPSTLIRREGPGKERARHMARRTRKSGSKSLDLLENEYRSLVPTAERFCTEISDQINTLLERDQIALALPIESRVKSWGSILDKLGRLTLKINSVKDLNDFVGLRMILLFKRDLDKVCRVLSSTFSVLKQYDTQERLKEDQFGYSSIHFIIELPVTWLAVPSMAQLGGLKAEVQVRTMAQHMWAAASHALQYKQEASVPLPLRRTIYRVSALLETIDLEFERVLDQRAEYRSSIELSESDEILNVDLLEKVLDSLLPQANKEEDEPYSDLLNDLLHFEVNTDRKLMRMLNKRLDRVLESDRERVAEILEDIRGGIFDEESHGEGAEERAKSGVFYAHVGLVRKAMEAEFGRKFHSYQMTKVDRLDIT